MQGLEVNRESEALGIKQMDQSCEFTERVQVRRAGSLHFLQDRRPAPVVSQATGRTVCDQRPEGGLRAAG